MKFCLADTENGIFERYETLEEAEAACEKWVAHGIACDKEMQDVNGLSDEDINEKVRDFYQIIEE